MREGRLLSLCFRPVGFLSFLLVAAAGPSAAHAEDPALSMEHHGAIQGLQGSYISMVHRGGEYQFFGNASGTNAVGLVMFTGTNPNAVGPGEVIAPNSLIDDLTDLSGQPDPTRMITRPAVRFSEKDQRYYAIVHVSRGYPPANGRVYPALLVSKMPTTVGTLPYAKDLHVMTPKSFD